MLFIFDLLAQVSLNTYIWLYIVDPWFERRTRIYEEYMMISKQNLKSNLDMKAFFLQSLVSEVLAVDINLNSVKQ